MSGSWKLVPVEAIQEQIKAHRHADKRRSRFTATAKRDYAAFLGAAPSPPDEVLERMAAAFIEPFLSGKDVIECIRAALAAAAAEDRTDAEQ